MLKNSLHLEVSDCVYFFEVFKRCLTLQLQQGNSVKIDGVGILKPTYRHGELNVIYLPDRNLKCEMRKTHVRIIDVTTPEDAADIEPLDISDL